MLQYKFISSHHNVAPHSYYALGIRILIVYCVSKLYLLSFSGGVFGSIITPDQTEVLKEEGTNVTLFCSYSTAISVQWYRQYPKSAPEYLLLILQTGRVQSAEKLDPRYSARLNEKKTQVYLEISSLQFAIYCVCESRVIMLFFTILLLALFKGKSFADVITAKRDHVFTTVGDKVTFSCNFSNSGYVPSLHWYRQYLGSVPQFLILEYSGSVVTANPPIQGISIKHRKEAQEVNLEISSVKVTDSALYYCALQPTVTENTTTLYKNLQQIIKQKYAV
ncbi:uncharacterized protein [Misgurnus anguillicaudatus]|uniref:uncharacterized protein n=1 Tax=Misgurnus anguillicaudatus TaxID=75329 RepID=UPI003CCF6D40